MASLEEFLKNKKPPQRCGVCSLPTAVLKQVSEALANDAVAGTWICEWLEEQGLRIHPDTMRRHRKGRCGTSL